MDTDVSEIWLYCFQHWPDDVPRRGVLVTTFDEQIPFDSFSCSDKMLLVERRTPDTLGGRTVLIPYTSIAAVKLVDVVKAKSFSKLGFAVAPPKK